VNKRVLLTPTGFAALILGMLDLAWVRSDWALFISFIPIFLVLGAFMIIKVGAIIMSWVFPT